MNRREDLAYRAVRLAVLGLSLLPPPLARGLGRGLGRLFKGLVRDRRRVARKNLAAAFPEKGPKWVEDTLEQCYAHLGVTALEVCRLLRLGPARAWRETRIHGWENFQRAKEKGRGVVLLTGHLGNWEWGGSAILDQVGRPMAVARPLDSPVADRLVNSWRGGSRVVVDKKRALRPLLRHLRDGGSLYILLDQNVFWREGVFVDFFGRPAATNSGLAFLTLASKAAVVPLSCQRAGDGRLDLRFHPEAPLVNTGDRTHDVWANTQNYTKAIEDMIRAAPAQWLWLHNRYKTRDRCPWPAPENQKKRWLD